MEIETETETDRDRDSGTEGGYGVIELDIDIVYFVSSYVVLLFQYPYRRTGITIKS